MFHRFSPYLPGILACLLFVALGVLFIPLTGVQYDEALFVSAIHYPASVAYFVESSFGKVPIMLMTYIGTLKAALYVPVFKYLGTTNATLRLPALLFGAASLWLFFLALRRLAGTGIAAVVSLLLATDSVYLLTCVFDWGPVALQHLLFMGAVYSFIRYAPERRAGWLFAGCFCAGLALWDKALFGWFLAGFGVALPAIFPRELWSIARSRRQLAAAVLGFALGAAPFLWYNQAKSFATLTENAERDQGNVAGKVLALDRSLDGSALMGYMVRDVPLGPPQNLKRWEKLPLWLNGVLKDPRYSLQHLLLTAGLMLAPLLCWSGPLRRVALLFLAGGLVAYLLMINTKGTGGSAHHTVLLWPIPQMLLGLAAAGAAELIPRRGFQIAAALVLVCVLSNLMVLNAHLAHFIAYGPTTVWSDAIRPLVAEIGSRPGKRVFAVDWGILQQVAYYSNGGISMGVASDGIVLCLPDAPCVRELETSLGDPATLFVSHTQATEVFAGSRQKLFDFAAARGYRDNLRNVIQDRHGVPIFEIHEFRK